MGRGDSPYYRRERSRSPRERGRRTYSRSPKRNYNYRKSRSRSPRRIPRGRYYDGRENPAPCPCLGVFGMSLHTNERDLKKIFGQYGEIETVQIVYDKYSGRSRGYGFVYFRSTREATRAKDHLKDAVIDGMKVRVDYSVTRSSGPSRHVRTSRSRSKSRCRSPVRRESSPRRRRRDSHSPVEDAPSHSPSRSRTHTPSRSKSRSNGVASRSPSR